MSKFFLHALLSLIVAAGATVSVGAEMRDKGKNDTALRQAQLFVDDLRLPILGRVSGVEAAAEISTKMKGKSALETALELEMELELPVATSLQAEVSGDTGLNLEVDRKGLDLKLENELEIDPKSADLKLDSQLEVDPKGIDLKLDNQLEVDPKGIELKLDSQLEVDPGSLDLEGQLEDLGLGIGN